MAQRLPHRIAIARELEAEQNDRVAAGERFGDKICPAEGIVAHVPGDDGDGYVSAQPRNRSGLGSRPAPVGLGRWLRWGRPGHRQRRVLELAVFVSLLAHLVRRRLRDLAQQQPVPE